MGTKPNALFTLLLVAFFLVIAFSSEEDNNSASKSSNNKENEKKEAEKQSMAEDKFKTADGTLDLIQGTWEGSSGYSVNYNNVYNYAHIRITIIGTDIKLDLGWSNTIVKSDIHDESVWEESFNGKIVVSSLEDIPYKGKCRVIKIQSNSGFPLWYRSMGSGSPAELAVYFRNLNDLTRVLSIDGYALYKIKDAADSKAWSHETEEHDENEYNDTDIDLYEMSNDEYDGTTDDDYIDEYVGDMDAGLSEVNETNGIFTDPRDNKTYKTIKIGNQVWMAENLAYKPTSGNYWAYGNNPSNLTKYGYLYDWKTACKACPSGWHLASDAEWTSLTNYLGGENIAGTKIKSSSGWKDFGNGTNESGFSGLPGGTSNSFGSFLNVGNTGYWWSSSVYYAKDAWSRNLSYKNGDIDKYSSFMGNGFSVRCIKD